MEKNNRKKLALILLFASFVLLLANLYNLDYSNFSYKDMYGPFSNVLIILAMYITIREIDQDKNL